MPQVVGIVGAGTMGSGIAQACLAAGKRVHLYDPDPAASAAARERIADGLARFVSKGRLTPEQHEAAMSSLVRVDGLAAVAQSAELVVEAAAEDLAIKQGIFAELDALSGADVVLATNTSSLSVAAIATATRRPERVIGLHFFNPVALMTLVEVVATTRTNVPTLELAIEFVASIGKTAVHSADAAGFIVNRVGRPFVLEAVRMLEAGQASVAAIDAALEAAGYPMGPFRLIDLIGLDVDLAIDGILFEAFDEAARFKPPALEQSLLDEGRLGRKSGHGFYRYGPGRTATPDFEAPRRVRAAPVEALAADAIVERVELATINEAYRAVEEAVASPPDVDTAMRLGAGHPLGPFERVDELGLRHIVTRLHELHGTRAERSADQYEVAASLWQMATV
ncbi:MAG: 3-hydroxyacyl-CoA dehydrogenase NAD-binding domain-containing protein [Chloroflexota bacterium]